MTISEIFNKMDWGTAPENDKNAKAWLKENGNKFGHFINGNFIDAKNHFKTKDKTIDISKEIKCLYRSQNE